MKKINLMLVLFISTGASLCAQNNNTVESKTFEFSPELTSRKFTIDIGKGNTMQIEISDLKDLDRFKNMDSLIYGFMQDMRLLKDSLTDLRTTKRVDYSLDDAEHRKIRLLQYASPGKNFVINNGEAAILKTEQDTVNFLGKHEYIAKYTMRKAFNTTRFYRVSLFVNDLDELAGYMNGSLNEKIISVQQNANGKWDSKAHSMVYSPIADPTIKANANKGYRAGGDFVVLRLSVDVQNFKTYFVPSLTYGAAFIFTSKNFKREIGLYSESHFSFAKNSSGKLQTFHDQFLTLNLAHGPIRDGDPKKESYQLANFTFSYLIKNRGHLYDKGTMKLAAGTLSIFEGKSKIQPLLYFTHFFKGVTPGIRWIQSF